VIDGALERSLADARDDKVSVLNGYDDNLQPQPPRRVCIVIPNEVTDPTVLVDHTSHIA
jgi:hypothetical protein